MNHAWVRQVIPGLYTLDKAPFADSRGTFHKILCELPSDCARLSFDEIYWSSSEKDVARGMHVQIPPFHGRKLVFATLGVVRDFVIDLRVGSPTYQLIWETELSPETPGVMIPAGCAHGFVVTTGPATLVYAQEGAYSPECDTGVSINSLDLSNLSPATIISDRDQQLSTLSEFISPFVYDYYEYSHWSSE